MKTVTTQAAQPLDAANFPETAKFQAWYEQQLQKGLLDIKFYPGNLENATLESFFKEVNAALSAPSAKELNIF